MAESAESTDWQETLRGNLRQIGPVRLIATLIVLVAAVHIARFAWDVPIASEVERALYDLRFQNKAERLLEQDNRIVLVTYNDETLAELGKRSPLDRAMLARALTAIDDMEPRGIGIDILIDQAQPEDPALIAALASMRTPTWLAFASAARNPDQILPWQEQFLRGFLARASGNGGDALNGRAATDGLRPASIRLEPDLADGVIRRWPAQPADLPPLLASAMAPPLRDFHHFTGGIDFRLPATSEQDDVPVFTNLPIQFVADFPEGVRDMIRGRYVLIGGDIQDLDDYETPMTRFSGRWTKGLEVHAHMLAQQLDGRAPPPLPNWIQWLTAIIAVAAGALTAMVEMRRWKLIALLAVEAALFLYLPFLLEQMRIETIDLPAFGWGAGWLLSFIAVGAAARAVGSEQRRFAQSALGKYLPTDVARQIMRDPGQIALRGEKKQIFALFTDLEGFTKLSHAITPEQLSELLNRYLDLMSDIVLKQGGTIDKFVGDAVVAFWGAPLSRPGDGERAVFAAIAMYEAGVAFCDTGGDDFPPIGCTRVGLHLGPAVVGNFGGEGRIQYTALGDGMNTAARLESANKALKTTALVSDEARQASGLDLFRPMGRIVLSGRATPIEVWEPMPHMDEAVRARLTSLWSAYDTGNRDALLALEQMAENDKEDAALRLFVYRLREAGPGGHFVLGSK